MQNIYVEECQTGLGHIQLIILIIYLNAISPFINHMRIKQWFYEFLRKITVLDLNLFGILGIQSLVFLLPGKNFYAKVRTTSYSSNQILLSRLLLNLCWSESCLRKNGGSLLPPTKAVPNGGRERTWRSKTGTSVNAYEVQQNKVQ